MPWNTTATGSFHEVNDQIRAFNPTSDPIAKENGHVQKVKDAALSMLDGQSADSQFQISVGGHSEAPDIWTGNITFRTWRPEPPKV